MKERGERLRRLAGSDGTHAVLFASLAVALDVWLLGLLRHDTVAGAQFLGCLVLAGAAVGLATGGLATWVQRRRSSTPGSRPSTLRALRWAATGALYIHLLPLLLIVVDVAIHPLLLVPMLGGVVG